MSKKNKFVNVKLIVNPRAGNQSDMAEKVKLAAGYLAQNGLKVDTVFMKPKEDASLIAKSAVKDGYKIVVAMGGDGTIKAVMRGLIGKKVRLGIIQAGTENNIAKSLDIPKEMKQACALIASDKTLKLDMGQVVTRKGKKFVFFELATVGLSAALDPQPMKTAIKNFGGIKTTAMTIMREEPRPTFYLTLDGESKIEVETMLVVVSNTPAFRKDFPVVPNALVRDGRLDVSVYPDFNKVELLRYYAAVMDGGYSGDLSARHYQARKIKIKTSPRLDVMADGVALGKGTISIKVRPGALRVITTDVGANQESPSTALDQDQSESVFSGPG